MPPFSSAVDAGTAALLQHADARLLGWITRKLLNHLRWMGVPEAIALLPRDAPAELPVEHDENRPVTLPALPDHVPPVADVFEIAARHCNPREVSALVRAWLSQDRVRDLADTLEDQGSSLDQIIAQLDHFASLGVVETELPRSLQTMMRVALLRRFFSDQLDFINAAKDLISIGDIQQISRRVLHPRGSHGKLGGKSAGLFLAERILAAAPQHAAGLGTIRVPRTWYIASDAVRAFVHLNSLEDVYDRKYSELQQVRQQYPHVIQVFKQSRFPPELVRGLSAALDELGDRPVIVRSSSLLEDRSGASFSGKYKSLFLANRGSRPERLRALQDAIAEVYASIFAPDPIEYRAERNLLDVHEEMGIMIQEVVGRRVGRYFLPAFAGVAFSSNEFRWSPRIRREDGLVRLVPGLGTRAVDRLSDDYPILLAPGQPGLRAKNTVEDIVRYSPRMVDLIDLERNSFATITVSELLRDCADQLPQLRRMISVVDGERVRRPTARTPDCTRETCVVTFEGLLSETPFLRQMRTLLHVLHEGLGAPVDIEFASDGTDFYLLQCRPQSYGVVTAPAEIPRDLAPERVLFSAHRHVSNGRVPDLGYIVYVDPAAYAALPERRLLHDVARAVGCLNKLLPRRQFALMGPGRWGSRGDIRLGVGVTYADVNNTAVLIEIARSQGGYVPDLSFGTHFFQDLVEAEIRYLPLYPDEAGNTFRDEFFRDTPNSLAALAPDYAHLDGVVRVIDVGAATSGLVLRVLLNGELDEAVGFLTEPAGRAPARARGLTG